MMRKIAIWLNEHAICLGDSIEANVVHLWCIVISFVLTLVFALVGWTGKPMEWLLAVLLLGGMVLPPLVALFKKPWAPWYWFPIVIGNTIGVGLAMLVAYIFGIV